MPDSIITKVCSKCKQVKPLEEFYPRKTGKHGRRADCIACRKAYGASPEGKAVQKCHSQTVKRKASTQRYRDSKKYAAMLKRYQGTTGHKDIQRKAGATYRRNHPDRANAHLAISYAIQRGKIPAASTLPCSTCPEQAQ